MNASGTRCQVFRLGQMEYEPAWRLQDRLAAGIAAGIRLPALLLLEHPHTYTFGRRGHAENLLWEADELAQRGITVHWVDRGGDVTYHGPGQLVGYPLLPLGTGSLRVDPGSGSAHLPQADYVGYLRQLERTLILALAWLGVRGEQAPGLTGVWVQPQALAGRDDLPDQLPAKIAAIGVKVDARGITRHGFALNVSSDKTYWKGIIGCGLKDYPVANLSDLLEPVPAMETVIQAVCQAFGEEFGYELVEAAHIPAPE